MSYLNLSLIKKKSNYLASLHNVHILLNKHYVGKRN